MTIASKIFGSLSKKKTSEGAAPAEPSGTEAQTPPQFGIKSYLHEFYDLKTPDADEGWYFTSQAPRKRGILLCRAFFAVGICLLVIGAVGIIVGYLWPDPLAKYQESVEESNGEPIQFDATLMPIGDRIKVVKIVALVLFALGGFTVAVALLIPTCCRLRGDESLLGEASGEGLGASETATICAGERVEPGGGGSPKISLSPMEKKIPLMEEIQSVQPAEKKGAGRTLSGSELLLADD